MKKSLWASVDSNIPSVEKYATRKILGLGLGLDLGRGGLGLEWSGLSIGLGIG